MTNRGTLLLSFVMMMLGTRLALADNPIIQTKYTADPAPLVHDGTVYLYTSHDEDNAVGFTMYNWMLYTTTDMANWTDHGIVAGVKEPYNTFPWAAGNNAWAPQAIEKNGKFYLYVPLAGPGGRMTMAVAVADSPFGPFKDALGKALVSTGTTDDIDPSVFIDTDGQAYLYWGNPNCYYVKLNPDMVSYSGSVVKIPKVQTYQEGPWFYRRGDNYYLAFASTCCPEGIGYAMSTTPTGPWTYKGSIMDGNSQSSGNHPGIIDYKGSSYVFGFNYNVQLQRENQRIGERRSICVEKMTYNADGTIPKLPFWSKTGPDQIEPLNPYVQTEAETIAWAWDVKTETCSEGGMDVTAIENGDYIKVKGVDFGGGASSLEVRVATAGSGGTIEVRLDSLTGKLVGSCAVSSTGGAQTWATKSCAIDNATGLHDLYFVFTGGSGSLFNFNWWRFVGSGPASDGGVGTGGTTGNDGGPATGGAGGSATGGGGGGRGGAGGSGTGGAGGSGAGGRGGQPTGSGGTVVAGAGGSAAGGAGGAQTRGGGAGGAAGGGSPATGGQAGTQTGVAGAVGTGGSGTVQTRASGGSAGGQITGTGGGRAGGGSVSSGPSAGGMRGGGGNAGSTGKSAASSGCSCGVGRSSETRKGVVELFLALALLAWRGHRRSGRHSSNGDGR